MYCRTNLPRTVRRTVAKKKPITAKIKHFPDTFDHLLYDFSMISCGFLTGDIYINPLRFK